MNKKGISLIPLFGFIFFMFLGIIFLGIGLWGFNLVNDSLDQNVSIGQVNLAEINSQTFGALNTAFIKNADLLGIVLILGMVFFMFLNAYFFGSRTNKMFIIIDILMLFFIFITSVYLSQVYDIFINSSPLIQQIYIDSIPKSSKFILNLPLFVSTIGVIVMIITYAGLGRQEEEQPNVLGFN